jgi:hypothetical protein
MAIKTEIRAVKRAVKRQPAVVPDYRFDIAGRLTVEERTARLFVLLEAAHAKGLPDVKYAKLRAQLSAGNGELWKTAS